MADALAFQNTTFNLVTRNNQPWLTMRDLVSVLYGVTKGGGQTDAPFENAEKTLRRLYERRKAEFTDKMTAVVKLPTAGGEQDTRIFSLRGAHLLAMFARTAIAVLFRKWVLDILDNQVTQPSARITTAQAQHLSELVHLVVESGRQKTLAETWARLHRKMQVNSYLELTADRFDAACQYLHGKMDDTSMAFLVQKHLPNALRLLPQPATPEKIQAAMEAANAVAARVQAHVFEQLMANGAEGWLHERFLLSFNLSCEGSVPTLRKISSDAYVSSLEQLPKYINNTMFPNTTHLARLGAAVNKRLAECLQFTEQKAIAAS